jgi:hypothetical protein
MKGLEDKDKEDERDMRISSSGTLGRAARCSQIFQRKMKPPPSLLKTIMMCYSNCEIWGSHGSDQVMEDFTIGLILRHVWIHTNTYGK